ncbi:hypothetical protein DENSPDRAFT_128238 [Dentipellis sp. KUC8613]|nr:hypothetical protein DENSPDRAFT_128238 [Dentipellis sp. KUC8613]
MRQPVASPRPPHAIRALIGPLALSPHSPLSPRAVHRLRTPFAASRRRPSFAPSCTLYRPCSFPSLVRVLSHPTATLWFVIAFISMTIPCHVEVKLYCFNILGFCVAIE